jgi:hypothetical protein
MFSKSPETHNRDLENEDESQDTAASRDGHDFHFFRLNYGYGYL